MSKNTNTRRRVQKRLANGQPIKQNVRADRAAPGIIDEETYGEDGTQESGADSPQRTLTGRLSFRKKPESLLDL